MKKKGNKTVEKDEVWYLSNGSKIAVRDIFDPLPVWMKADLIFIDPPYNQGQFHSYYSKANLESRGSMNLFVDRLFECIKNISPEVVYIETGNQAIGYMHPLLARLFPVVQQWEITYYRKFPTNLLRGSFKSIDYNWAYRQ